VRQPHADAALWSVRRRPRLGSVSVVEADAERAAWGVFEAVGDPMRKRDPTIVLSGVPGELDLTVSARPVASRRQLTWSGTPMPGLRRRGSTAGAALCQTLRSRSRQA